MGTREDTNARKARGVPDITDMLPEEDLTFIFWINEHSNKNKSKEEHKQREEVMIDESDEEITIDELSDKEQMDRWRLMLECVRDNEPPYNNKGGNKLGNLWLHLGSYMAHRVIRNEGQYWVPTNVGNSINQCQVEENKVKMKNFLQTELRIVNPNTLNEICVKGDPSKFKKWMQRNRSTKKDVTTKIMQDLPLDRLSR